MRKRKRPDYRQVVYKFWARPIAALPDEYWEHAKGMQQLWNDLVEYRETFYEQVKDLPDAERKEKWKGEFSAGCRSRAQASSIGYESTEAVLARFQTASVAAAKSKATLRKQYGLRKINIHHRYTGGGLPVEKFLNQSERAKRVRFDRVPEEAYEKRGRAAQRQRFTEGVFSVGDASFNFDVHAGRQIPSDAIVKQVRWCADFNQNRRRKEIEQREGEPRAQLDSRWESSLQILVEIPPVPKPKHDTRPIASLDLGWRLMNQGSYVRIGYLVDSEGNQIEFRLPVNYRNQDVVNDKLPNGDYTYYTWSDLFVLDGKIGTSVQETKGRIYSLVPARHYSGWVKMRQGGLYKIIRELAESGEAAEAQEILSAWRIRYEHLAMIRIGLWEKLKRRQDWWYGNLAAWLTKRYRAVVWEGELNLKEIAEAPLSMVTDAALKRGQKFRSWASLYKLRQKIAFGGVKNFCDMIAAPTVDSTITCHECGDRMIRSGAALLIECPNGHRHDQDYNAAMNFLQWGTRELLWQEDQRSMGYRRLQTIDIPVNLRPIIAIVSAE